MLVYSLVISVCGDNRSLLSRGMDTIAEVVHKHQIPVSWALNSRFIKSLGKKTDEWHKKYSDQIILMLNVEQFLPDSDKSEQKVYAEQVVQMRENLREYIESEREKCSELLSWASLDVAGAIQKNRVLIQILQELGFRGLWGYRWKRERNNPDYGCPFGYFYPSQEAHNIPGEPSSRIVGIPFETPSFFAKTQLKTEFLQSKHSQTESLHSKNICIYLNNTKWNRWLGYVQHFDATKLANLKPDELEYFDQYFEWLKSQSEWQFMSVNDAVTEYRLSFGKSEPTSIFSTQEQDKNLFYYDEKCQLYFREGEFTPDEIRNYVSPSVKATHCIEFNPPSLVKFNPSRTRNRLIMKFNIDSPKDMPYGLALWDIPETLNLIESDRFRAIRLGENLILLRFSLESGKNEIRFVMTI